jgi:protein-S-isoprenylcysteine O-methyltransferase Ste14
MPALSQARNFIVTLLFTIFGGPGILGVYLPAAITRWSIPPSPAPLRVLAWLLIAIGLVPLAESIARFVWAGRGTLAPFAPTEALVISGFYRHVRNPMYVGVLAGVAGQVILFRSLTLAAYAALLALGFHEFVTRYEEPTLRKKYGVRYDDFRANVPRWIPRWTPGKR